MDDEFEIMAEIYKSRGIRRLEIVNGRLKWGYHQGRKFEFVHGQKYKVSHLNPARTRHKGAVGVYVRSRAGRSSCSVTLECQGEKFQVDALSIVPWEGEITPEHRKLISPARPFHLLVDSLPICRCTKTPNVAIGTHNGDDFLIIPENSRCKNCNSIAKTSSKE